jgi:MYXO-CTERM domain-containing protein
MSLRVLAIGVIGLALLALGVVYLSVECQSLPAFMGPTHGDTAPRSGLGVACVALGMVGLAAGFLTARRRPPA